MLSRFMETASSFAGDIDELILLITLSVGFWFLVAEFVLLYLILKFRAKDGRRGEYITGELWRHKRWVSLPHYAILVFDVLIVIAALRVWVNVKQTMPPPDATVRVIAQQWSWTFIQPGLDGKLDTPDDIRTLDDLYVENGKTYHFELASKDVLHSFSVPVFRLKQDAIPGRVIKGWFKPTLTGTFDVQCAEICGLGHGVMQARIHIQTAAEHADWMRSHQALAAASPGLVAPAPSNPPQPAAPPGQNPPPQAPKTGETR